MRLKALTNVHFHYAQGFDTLTLAHDLDSLVRVSRRAACNHYANIRANARSSVQVGRMTPWAISRPGRRYIPKAFIRPPELMLA